MRNKRILLGVYSRIVPKIRQAIETIGRVRKYFFQRLSNATRHGFSSSNKQRKTRLLFRVNGSLNLLIKLPNGFLTSGDLNILKRLLL